MTKTKNPPRSGGFKILRECFLYLLHPTHAYALAWLCDAELACACVEDVEETNMINSKK